METVYYRILQEKFEFKQTLIFYTACALLVHGITVIHNLRLIIASIIEDQLQTTDFLAD